MDDVSEIEKFVREKFEGNGVSALTDREAEILRLRFGLEGMDRHTYRAVGEVFGVSRSRIAQIVRKSIRKLGGIRFLLPQ